MAAAQDFCFGSPRLKTTEPPADDGGKVLF